MTMAQQFRATITRSGSKTFIVIPFDPDAVWGKKERHHITGSVNGCRVRGALTCDGLQHVLSLGAAWRRDNGLDAGAEVDVILTPEGPQAVQLSPDITAALEAEPEASAFFASLATFYRNNYVRWIESAKRSETRAARIRETVGLLKAGRKAK